MSKKKQKSKSKILEFNHKKNSKNIFKSLLYVVYVLILVTFIGYHFYYSNKIIPRVSVNNNDVSGYTTTELIEFINKDLSRDMVVEVNIGDSYSTSISKSDVDFQFLAVRTTQNAFDVGRNQGFLRDTLKKITTLISPVHVSTEYNFSETKMENLISEMKSEAGVLMQETEFRYENGDLVIIPGESGLSFDNEFLIEQILAKFNTNDSTAIHIELETMEPNLTVADLESVQSEILDVVSESYFFTFRNRRWDLSPEEKVAFFEVVKEDSGEVNYTVNKLAVANKLSEIADEVDRNPRGQVLEVENGRAVQFIESQDGLKVKLKETAELTETNLLEGVNEIPLAVQVVSAPESENEFGIEQIIGTGVSKFAGSAAGRVHNIELASSRVSGILVAPGDIFSFNESIGEISRRTGYTSAWVISKGRTVLGDGGGVCQVSTTVFRAALNAGLPIVERSAHSYRVGYYEQDSPTGLDATIYIPTVDLKFRNDTSEYILITSEVDTAASTLVFNIYGTDDGRTVEVSEPQILSQSSPPAPIYEEDPTLPKGQQIRVESPVAGASVVFTRIVKRGDEILYEDTFRSNYRAWGAVYRVGTKEN